MYHPVAKHKQLNGQNSREGQSPEERASSNNSVEVCCRKEGFNTSEPSYTQAEPYKCTVEQN